MGRVLLTVIRLTGGGGGGGGDRVEGHLNVSLDGLQCCIPKWKNN